MTIRDERPEDHEAITAITKAAFEKHPFSRQTEHFIVLALRRAGALALSLVAEIDGKVAGHIAFSPVSTADGSPGWFGMGPVSVDPPLQRRGIGSALVREGLERLRGLGARGCALVGDPHFYERFGFCNEPECTFPGIPQEYFLVLPLGPDIPRGAVIFHEAFGATD